jgi:hypothetical protein
MNEIDNKFNKEIKQKLTNQSLRVLFNSRSVYLEGAFNMDELKYITEKSEKYLKYLEDKAEAGKSEKKCHSCDGKKYYISYDGYCDPCRICNLNDKLNILK